MTPDPVLEVVAAREEARRRKDAPVDVEHGSPADRLHDRRLFRRQGDGWTVGTLVP